MMKQRDIHVKEIFREVFRETIAAASEKDEAKTKNLSRGSR